MIQERHELLWNFKHYIVHREEYIHIHWQFYILYSDEIAGNESQFLLIYIGQLDIFSIGYCQLLLEFRQQTVASNRKVAIIRTIAQLLNSPWRATWKQTHTLEAVTFIMTSSQPKLHSVYCLAICQKYAFIEELVAMLHAGPKDPNPKQNYFHSRIRYKHWNK